MISYRRYVLFISLLILLTVAFGASGCVVAPAPLRTRTVTRAVTFRWRLSARLTAPTWRLLSRSRTFSATPATTLPVAPRSSKTLAAPGWSACPAPRTYRRCRS